MQKYQRTGTLVLIWAVPSDLTAQIRLARGAAAEGRRRPSSAAALRGSSSDLAKLGRPGVKSTRIWVWGARHGTRNSPGGSVELGRVLDDAGTGGGGSAQRCPTACRCWVALGSDLGATECACVREANATQTRIARCCAMLQRCPPRRIRGEGRR